MKKIQENDTAFQTEGCDVYSVELTLMDKHVINIKKALALLQVEGNDFINSISVDAWEVDIKQFDSSMDDEDREEIKYEDFNYFKSDCSVFMVSEYSVTFRAYNKWDSSFYFEVDVKIED